MKKADKRDAGVVLRMLFLVYCGLMLWLLFGQRLTGEGIALSLHGTDNVNLIPFTTLKLYWRLLHMPVEKELLRHAVINLAGNVVMFVPLGWFLPAIWEKFRGIFKTLLLSAVLIAAVEICQYVTALGSCDVDDWILNLTGVLVGYGFCWLTRRK